MRNIVKIDKLMKRKDFIVWFIMNCFPEGVDEESDMSIYDVIEENYIFDMDWFNNFTNYYDGVFEENDGYVDNPNSIVVLLNNNNELIIEFHPGYVIFFLNNIEIGCTGPHYNIKSISFNKYIELTENVEYDGKLFLLPMIKVSEEEKKEFEKILWELVSKYQIKECCLKQIVKIIINNCSSYD